MQVILQEDFPSLGYIGDKVNVRNGFARNYLLPRGIAIAVTTRNMDQLTHKLAAITAKKARMKAAAEEQAKLIGSLTLGFSLKVGKQGKTFGSITAKDVEIALQQQGQNIERRRIRLVEPLKKIGSYQVEVKLHSEVVVPVAVEIKAEHVVEKEEGAPEEGKKKRGRGRKKAESEGADGAAKEAAAPEAAQKE